MRSFPRWSLLLAIWLAIEVLTGCRRTTPAPVFVSPLKPAPFTSPLTADDLAIRATEVAKGVVSLGLEGRIAFHSERSGNFDIWTMNGDGSDLRQLTTDPGLDVEPTWSPDGKQLVFVTSRTDPSTLTLYIMNADGSDQRLLLRIPDGLCMGPAWSPDGSRVAFFSNVDGNFELYLVNTDGTGLTNLTKNPANDSRPSWSPDGKQLAFVSDRDEGENIYILDLNSGAIRRLTIGYYTDNLPHWSPDGSTILFVSNRAGGKGLYTVPTNGGIPKLVLTPPHNDDSPAWAGNGRFILFSSERSGDWELYAMRSDGSRIHQLTLSEGMDRFPAWTP